MGLSAVGNCDSRIDQMTWLWQIVLRVRRRVLPRIVEAVNTELREGEYVLWSGDVTLTTSGGVHVVIRKSRSGASSACLTVRNALKGPSK